MTSIVKEARARSIFSPLGKIFLIATAHSYGYDVDEDYNLLDDEGNILPSNHEDYRSIVKMAQAQATTESHLGSDMDA